MGGPELLRHQQNGCKTLDTKTTIDAGSISDSESDSGTRNYNNPENYNDPEKIKRANPKFYADNFSDDKCAVCYREKPKTKQSFWLTKLPCTHTLHKGCVIDLRRSTLEKRNKAGQLVAPKKEFRCPECRYPLVFDRMLRCIEGELSF